MTGSLGMTVLIVNESFDAAEPVLRVDNRLGVGRHLFALRVGDAQGHLSEPDMLVVTVRLARVPGQALPAHPHG